MTEHGICPRCGNEPSRVVAVMSLKPVRLFAICDACKVRWYAADLAPEQATGELVASLADAGVVGFKEVSRG